MARAGDVIVSSVSGERTIFRQTAKDTQGTLLQFDTFMAIGGQGPVEHVHVRQEERFDVIAGTMGVSLNGQERLLRPGEFVVIPPGAPHRWWNGGAEELQVRTELRPALNAERFYETIYGLARDGKTDAFGRPAFLQIVAMGPVYELFLPKPPILLQRLLFAIVGPFAKLCGYRAWYPKYSPDAEEAV